MAYTQFIGMLALLVSSDTDKPSLIGRCLKDLIRDVEARTIKVLVSDSLCDATALLRADTAIQCVLLSFDMDKSKDHQESIALLDALRERNGRVPVFLISNRSTPATVPVDVMKHVDDFIWLPEDTGTFISGRIYAAIERYRLNILPPMFSALMNFARTYEYSWHTPGHAGGTAFLKTPAGRAFHEFFGENLLRSDLSVSVPELGSLLDHSGPIGQGERYAAKVFGAHDTYFVTNGSSMSNRVILMASVTRNQIALCDRNCHKSSEHAMTLSGAIPTYLMPTRNRYGIMGPIRPKDLTAASVADAIDNNPLVDRLASDFQPKHAIITNSTYDGLTYNVCNVTDLLGESVDRLHFDEAWYGYARFNPLFIDRFAMTGDPAQHDESKPSVFATQSTHKLLAALSQASMIHVRNGKSAISSKRFNESYLMHATTSPNYAIIASCDVSSAMMDLPNGCILTNEALDEAIAFRQVMSSMTSSMKGNDWFFACWQPLSFQIGQHEVPFHEMNPQDLKTFPVYWTLQPNEVWHGFGNIEEGSDVKAGSFCMLDPFKVSILTPGMGDDGELLKWGIPACVLTAHLGRNGSVVEKTNDFSVLVLFSISITKGKWGTLLNALLEFKRDYDANTKLELCLPDLLAANPKTYAGMGLRDLANYVFQAMTDCKCTSTMSEAFKNLPDPQYTPSEAYEKLVKDEVDLVTLEGAAGRFVATGVVPYPPGIPLLMPGENAGSKNGPMLEYLKALQAFDKKCPGFTHDTHGIETDENGDYKLLCLK